MAKKNRIEILALMDRSGSMRPIIEEAVGAFNNFIESQRSLNLGDKVKVTLACFDDKYDVVFDRVPLEELRDLTVEDVQPRGMTALNDGIGKLISSAKHPERDTILLIQTDGFENASREYSGHQVRDLISEKEEKGWDVTFIGAGLSDMDVKKIGGGYGLSMNKSISVAASAEGMRSFSETIASVSSEYRNSKSIDK